jgi:hypothetical protein
MRPLMRLRRTVLALVLSTVAAAAQADDAPDAHIPPELVVQRFRVATGGDALLVPVRVGGKDRLFLVDTGCPLTVFDASLPLGRLRGFEEQLATVGGIDKVKAAVYDAPDATVGGLPLRVPHVAGEDLG